MGLLQKPFLLPLIVCHPRLTGRRTLTDSPDHSHGTQDMLFTCTFIIFVWFIVHSSTAGVWLNASDCTGVWYTWYYRVKNTIMVPFIVFSTKKKRKKKTILLNKYIIYTLQSCKKSKQIDTTAPKCSWCVISCLMAVKSVQLISNNYWFLVIPVHCFHNQDCIQHQWKETVSCIWHSN